jgi:hypothetical protein
MKMQIAQMMEIMKQKDQLLAQQNPMSMGMGNQQQQPGYQQYYPQPMNPQQMSSPQMNSQQIGLPSTTPLYNQNMPQTQVSQQQYPFQQNNNQPMPMNQGFLSYPTYP